jgi:16S rRNA (uracil1498-N3)-methyltransferase
MNLFFADSIENGTALLPEEESSHCIRVLRMKAGDEIFFTDGAGNLYSGVIEDPHPKKCLVGIREIKPEFGKKKYSLHVAIAPTKNTDRLEWFLEKATEIGIDEITPVICMRSERRELKTERLKKVLLSAMKQSLKAYLPVLNEAVEVEKFLAVPAAADKFICSMHGVSHLSAKVTKGNSCMAVIGPEGDFTEEELAAAQKNNFLSVTLGESRLRTETAGVVACTIVSLQRQ